MIASSARNTNCRYATMCYVTHMETFSGFVCLRQAQQQDVSTFPKVDFWLPPSHFMSYHIPISRDKG